MAKDQKEKVPWISPWKALGPGHVLDRLRRVLADPERKSLAQMLKEFAGVSCRTREIGTHYFGNLLYRRVVENPLDYLGNMEIKRVQLALLKEQYIEFLDNKIAFHEHFRGAPVRLPKLLAYSLGPLLFLPTKEQKAAPFQLDSVCELKDNLEKLFCRSNGRNIFMKPVRGACGRGIQMLSLDMLRGDQRRLDSLLHMMADESFIFEESVVQHEGLDRLYSGSLNTIRIDTFRPPEAGPSVISALLRVGAHGAVVDNAANGGVFVGIDLKTGTLKSTAHTKLGKGNQALKCHPDSKVEFDGFLLPHIQDVIDTALAAAAHIPLTLVGWDVAIGKDGPVLIEGNWFYGMGMSDVAYGGYRRNEVYQQVERLLRRGS